jgi:hypothetical protein
MYAMPDIVGDSEVATTNYTYIWIHVLQEGERENRDDGAFVGLYQNWRAFVCFDFDVFNARRFC